MRTLRSLAYLLIGLAGILLCVSPVFRSTATALSLTMAVFLAVGGALSAAGSATVRWVGEFMGLPLLASAFAVFGVLTFNANFHGAPYLAAANLALLFGLALLFVARWRYVLSVFQAADRFSSGRNPHE